MSRIVPPVIVVLLLLGAASWTCTFNFLSEEYEQEKFAENQYPADVHRPKVASRHTAQSFLPMYLANAACIGFSPFL
jgi:hypothetical protein